MATLRRNSMRGGVVVVVSRAIFLILAVTISIQQFPTEQALAFLSPPPLTTTTTSIVDSITRTSVVVGGRVAVVTGANRGIGYFIAQQLGRSGQFQHIVVGCRNPARASAARQSLQQDLSNSKYEHDNSPVQVHTAELQLGDPNSHQSFVMRMRREFGKIDVLVNNVGVYDGTKPSLFDDAWKSTIDINYRGTVDFTSKMFPLLLDGLDSRLVTMTSILGKLDQLSSPALAQKFVHDDLTMEQLNDLVGAYERDVLAGVHQDQGWGGHSPYSLSKLALIAATKVWARRYGSRIAINCCCPGFCKTEINNNTGTREPSECARNALIPATMQNPPSGAFFSNYKVIQWL